jgi:glycosyltransferase Alg8
VTFIKESAGNNSSARLSESVGAHVLYVVAVAAFAAALPPQAYGAVSASAI